MMTETKSRTNDGPKIRKEKKIVAKMIRIYCRRKHHRKDLCDECQELHDYALKRLSYCQFGEEKTACAKCPIHCYKAEQRQRIKEVMRYSGPWMLLYDPIESLKHIPRPGRAGK